MSHWRLPATFSLSLLLHGFVLYYGPGPQFATIPPPAPDEPHPVELIRRAIPMPPPPEPKPPPAPRRAPEPPPPPSPPKPIDLAFLKKSLKDRRFVLRPPAVRPRTVLPKLTKIPQAPPLPAAEEALLSLPKDAAQKKEDRLLRAAPGEARVGVPSLASDGSLPLPSEVFSLGSETTRRLLERELEEALRAYRERRRGEKRVRGPAAARRVQFRPKPPRVRGIESSIEIELKFWVLPDGTVGRVVPVKKGDARLEAAAISHLKRWRFSPLPADAAQVEQWGTVAFKFRLR
ncbi:MAG: TonB family protein [Nitrospinota bacterium]